MNKIVVLLVLCILLTACANNTNLNQTTDPQPTSSSDTKLSQSSHGTYIPLVGYYDMESYREFVEQTELPEDFVYYEDLLQFGEFDSLVFLNENLGEYGTNYSKYLYAFVDEHGMRLSLYVGENYTKLNPVDSKYWGDMQAGDPSIDKTDACIDRNGISYQYLGGKLTYIYWEHNGIQYVLGTEVKGDIFYPDDGPLTIIHELLHTDTNKAALEKINAALETPAVK